MLIHKKESLCNRRKSASLLPGNPRNKLKGNKAASSESQMQVQKNLSFRFNSYLNIQTGRQAFFLSWTLPSTSLKAEKLTTEGKENTTKGYFKTLILHEDLDLCCPEDEDIQLWGPHWILKENNSWQYFMNAERDLQ